MAIDKINFSYPKGTLQSIFDNEALTALELAAKTSKKVDECVEIVNGVEQTAIEATAIVDDMYVIQNQFVTDNSDTRAQLVNDNQSFIDGLVISKQQFETNMTNEVSEIIENSRLIIENDVALKIDDLVNDGTLNTIINDEILLDVKNDVISLETNMNDLKKNTGKVVNVSEYQTLQNAINYAITIITQKPILYFPFDANIETETTVLIPPNISVIMESPLTYTGLSNEPALVIGQSNVPNFVQLKLWVIRENISDWVNENCIGIKIYNSTTQNINIIESTNFTIGVELIGDGRGFAYNTITLGELTNNKISLLLNNSNSGWCNENLFIGGRFTNFSMIGVGLSRYGVKIASNEMYYNNNNVFIKPSFELNKNTASPGEAIPILIEYGSSNQFKDIRNESNSITTVRLKNNSTDNIITAGYGDIYKEDLSEYPTNVIKSTINASKNECVFNIYNSGTLYNKACYYTAESVHVADTHITISSNGTINKDGNDVNIMPGYIECLGGRGVGVMIDTNLCKHFLIKRNVEISNPGRIGIRCYDENGNVLNDVGVNHPYVKGGIRNVLTYTSAYGGIYRQGVDNGNHTEFQLHDDVKKIALLITSGTKPLRIKSFSIYADSTYDTSVYSGYNTPINNALLSKVIPTLGTWKRGTYIFNDNIVEYGTTPNKYIIKGWYCIQDGTPGYWLTEYIYTETPQP